MKTLIVIPTYNERQSVDSLFDEIAAAAPEAHVLVVDDASPDGTALAAEALFRSRPEFVRYRVMVRQGPRGLGRAYRDGFAVALREGYDQIVQMDADGSHEPKYLPRMIELGRVHDLVIGSRYCGGGGLVDWPIHRRWLSRFANAYVHRITGLPFTDATAGFRCWSRAGLGRIDLPTVRAEGYSFQVEMSYRAVAAGLRCVEMPIVFTDRKGGKSKISRKVLVESMVRPWVLRFQGWKPASPSSGTPGEGVRSERTED